MAEFIEVVEQRERMCNYYSDLRNTQLSCQDCDLRRFASMRHRNCAEVLTIYPQEVEEIIMKWASEHPAQTNDDKFKEVFGFEPDKGTCVLLKSCEECSLNEKCNDNGMRSVSWWNEEYKAPEEVENEDI